MENRGQENSFVGSSILTVSSDRRGFREARDHNYLNTSCQIGRIILLVLLENEVICQCCKD